MPHKLELRYGGANISLKFEERPKIKLLINGIDRDSASSAEKITTLRVNSSVQTEYEWHEFVEGIVTYEQLSIKAEIKASGKSLKKTTINL